MSRNFENFDEKNIEIAKMLINDSEKITIDEKTNEKIIKSIRNGRKKKFTGIYKMATAVAACIVLVAGMTIWNHVNTKEVYKSSGSSSYSVFRTAKQITLMQRQSRHFPPVIAASVLQMGITAAPQAPKLPPVHSCHPAARGKPQSRPARQESYQCCRRFHTED